MTGGRAAASPPSDSAEKSANGGSIGCRKKKWADRRRLFPKIWQKGEFDEAVARALPFSSGCIFFSRLYPRSCLFFPFLGIERGSRQTRVFIISSLMRALRACSLHRMEVWFVFFFLPGAEI